METFVQLYQSDPGRMMAMIAVVGGLSIGAISVVSKSIVRVCQTSMRERSRRELAAYVAEGTIAPDVAERMLVAGQKSGFEKWCG